jgi:hypothetical protein
MRLRPVDPTFLGRPRGYMSYMAVDNGYGTLPILLIPPIHPLPLFILFLLLILFLP